MVASFALPPVSGAMMRWIQSPCTMIRLLSEEQQRTSDS